MSTYVHPNHPEDLCMTNQLSDEMNNIQESARFILTDEAEALVMRETEDS